MVLFELVGRSEEDRSYHRLAMDNLSSQYHFLQSIIAASIESGWNKVSSGLIKSLNHHAIACLHVNAGEYRPCDVEVGDFVPPPHYLVPELMNEFVNSLNRNWERTDAISLGSLALWKLNHIHPFINGNGRTARALSYYLICVKSGRLLSGDRILPQLIRDRRDECTELLRRIDEEHLGVDEGGFSELRRFIQRLLEEQMSSL